MAHSCPECGSCCHCNGDIDDCLLDFDDDINACVHCPVDGIEQDDYETWCRDEDMREDA